MIHQLEIPSDSTDLGYLLKDKFKHMKSSMTQATHRGMVIVHARFLPIFIGLAFDNQIINR
ncbi:hypothetical protein SAMN04489723_12040 [Algoriphagus aquimarinus]|uniref:Uncharacterized protein n=1 Tax=Algoriphagus aquimarinus TaxID=237018 RepID=A0A1I1C282_9BACT|nr:hypothetical protein SAMN04489723_12040 [Algoriphagus aquimarinus]